MSDQNQQQPPPDFDLTAEQSRADEAARGGIYTRADAPEMLVDPSSVDIAEGRADDDDDEAVDVPEAGAPDGSE